MAGTASYWRDMLSILNLWPFFKLVTQFFLDGLRPTSYLGDDRPDDPILLLNGRQQQVDGFDDLML